jgi:hypothetical protein
VSNENLKLAPLLEVVGGYEVCQVITNFKFYGLCKYHTKQNVRCLKLSNESIFLCLLLNDDLACQYAGLYSGLDSNWIISVINPMLSLTNWGFILNSNEQKAYLSLQPTPKILAFTIHIITL